ncbi:MAG: aldolase catalytic domain-containing protein [Firmicutes bacterium]|nr:aldolase catalytic domain-containing protein [Bacillota bacterium]
MSNIRILDCTLRDGGYINDWRFGLKNIKNIISKLNDAYIDFIEVGFLEDKPEYEYNAEKAFFNTVDQIESLIPAQKKCRLYVAMSRYGRLDTQKLKYHNAKSIDGIRVTFHIDEVDEALEFCKRIDEKGYLVFIQPVGTTMYTDEELLRLIKKVNGFKPYAFYVVDTLGVMQYYDIQRLFLLVDNNLDSCILRGFHSHNNLQMSFSNAQALSDIKLKNKIIIDSSVDGMGRGAGNLNTELITEYLNTNKGGNYRIEYLLEIIDEYIRNAKNEHNWGYSIPYYLAAVKNCHPSYATYLTGRQTLPISAISRVLDMIPKNQSELFDKELINSLYFEFQKHHIDDSDQLLNLSNKLRGKNILLIAPGKSVVEHEDVILRFINENNPTIITINHFMERLPTDYLFFSNQKRYESFNRKNANGVANIVVTSNIQATKGDEYVFDYSSLLNDISYVKDNATLILLKLLKKVNIDAVTIAGLDGYLIGSNYYKKELDRRIDDSITGSINQGMREYIRKAKKDISITFLTPSLYDTKD